jgi:SAM-dependent methyltransferase
MNLEVLSTFYEFLWPATGAEDRRKLLAYLDQDEGFSEADFLYRIADEMGIGPGSTILDLGCGRGDHAVRLAQRYRCRVMALDVLPRHVAMAKEAADQESVATRVEPMMGSFEDLPLADESVDFVWCRDSLNHSSDLTRSLREIARVLRPGGRFLNYAAVATARCPELAREDFLERLGINPDTLRAEVWAEAARAAGLTCLREFSTSDERSPFREEVATDSARDVLRLARLVRRPEACAARFGPAAYPLLVALYTWRAYWTIGKFEQHVWIFSRAPGSTSDGLPR